MADDAVDTSDMPDPTTIGLKPPAAPATPAGPAGVDTSDMPTPRQVYYHRMGYDQPGNMPAETPSDSEVARFMSDPDAFPDMSKPQKTGRQMLSAMSGLPSIAAQANPFTPVVAGAVGGLYALPAAIGADLEGTIGNNPDEAARLGEVAREHLRAGAGAVYNLANYLPSKVITKEGQEYANRVLGLPQTVAASAAPAISSVIGEPATTSLGEYAGDAATLLPGAGAKGLALRGVGLAKAGARAAAGALKPDVVPEGTTYDQGGTAVAPDTNITPPVGKPVTGDQLRAQTNPIPAPEGTVHHTLTEEGKSPAAPPEPTAKPASTTAAAPTEGAAPEPSPSAAPEPEPTDTAPLGATAAGADERGSARIFNSPKEEGPQETPKPEEQDQRAAALKDLDDLSGGGLPSRRASAVSGDYNDTGRDWQLKETDSAPMVQQVASENNALHTAATNVHDSVGSLSDDSVDQQTMSDRGRTVRGALQSIQGWFQKATDESYDAARAVHGNQPMPQFLNRVKGFLSDDANYMPEGFRKSAQARLNQLKTVGDNGVAGDGSDAVGPGSVGAAEKFREWLNQNRTLDNAHTVKQLVDHTDTDVTEQGGPGLFQTARAMRRHQYQMTEEPKLMGKLLSANDSQGINHSVEDHKVMDTIAEAGAGQHEHLMNVLRAGAHLGSGELAESSAAAIREIQGHLLSRLHDAATDDGGKWNARSFYNATQRYGRNAASTFADRPDILRNLKTINDAGNVLHMDKHYPGAVGQGVKSGLGAAALKGAGNLAASAAHEIPVVGRLVGRGIEGAVEGMSEKGREAARDKVAMSRLVDRNGKQRGSVQVMNGDSPADRVKKEFDMNKPDAPAGYLGKRVGKATAEIYKDPGDPNTVHLEKLTADQPGSGAGTTALKHITNLADKHGANVTLDAVPQGKSPVSRERLMSYYERHGFKPDGNTESSMTREPAGNAAAKVAGNAAAKVARDVSARRGAGVPKLGDMFATNKAYAAARAARRNPGERGSFSFQNDNDLNRATGAARDRQRGAGIEPRNERNERVANQQMGGKRPLSAEQNEILRRLSGQRGSVRVMNEKPLEGAPEGDRPNGSSENAYNTIASITGSGPYDGGCVLCANAIKNKIGGRIVSLVSKDGVSQHAMVEKDGEFHDFGGSVENKKAAIDKFNKQENLKGTPREVRDIRPFNNEKDLPDAPRGSDADVAKVSKDLPDMDHPLLEGSQLNIGLHQGQEGQPGFKKMSKQQAQAAVESTGAKVTKNTVLMPKPNGPFEPTSVMSTDRPLTHEEMQQVLAKTKQSAIPQRTDAGETSMHVAPGHEETAAKEGWNQFSPDYFREHNGQSMSDATTNPKNIHPASTVKNPTRSAYPGIYDDPKDVVSKVQTSPESKHLEDIFGTTRQKMHDDVIRQGDVAPKTPMPGIAPKAKGSMDAMRITTPENAARLRDSISAFKDAHPEAYKGMVSWYHMDPMFRSIKKILGGDADKAGDVFHKLNTYTSLSSPMSSVEPEIKRGTMAAEMAAEGKFNQFAEHGGNPGSKTAMKKAPDLQTASLGAEGHAFHSTAHAPALTRFNEYGEEARAPKTGAYRRASDAPSRPGSDYQNTVMVGDSHFSRGAGLADVRGAKSYDGSISGPELKTVAPWYHENVAKKLGIPATSAQAVQWAALSHETGVDTAIGAPKLEIFANEIAKAAHKAGVEPKEMWERIVKRLAK